jgi:hypothetical protein
MSELSYYKDDFNYWDFVAAEPSDQIFWTTRDGESIPVRDMTSDHIKNCLSYFSPRLPAFWLEVFRRELQQRGEP